MGNILDTVVCHFLFIISTNTVIHKYSFWGKHDRKIIHAEIIIIICIFLDGETLEKCFSFLSLFPSFFVLFYLVLFSRIKGKESGEILQLDFFFKLKYSKYTYAHALKLISKLNS